VTGVAGDLEAVSPPPALESLVSRLEHTPVLERFDAEIERRAAAVRLERARAFPDLYVSAGGRHYNDNEDYAAVFSFNFPLPFFDRNQGGIAESEHLLEKARAERAAALLEARTLLQATHDDAQLQFERIASLRDRMLVDAREASDQTRQAYRRGAAYAQDVLAAQRAVLDLQEEYLQALADYQTTLIDVESLAAVGPTAAVSP
jgi:cobalt-zinc-cadmium efflux system outer membrane protein